jgi:hypothetical protein
MRYGGGTMLGDPNDCGSASSNHRDPPSLTTDRVAKMLDWAERHDGDTYRISATGSNACDCSSFTQAEYAQWESQPQIFDARRPEAERR